MFVVDGFWPRAGRGRAVPGLQRRARPNLLHGARPRHLFGQSWRAWANADARRPDAATDGRPTDASLHSQGCVWALGRRQGAFRDLPGCTSILPTRPAGSENLCFLTDFGRGTGGVGAVPGLQRSARPNLLHAVRPRLYILFVPCGIPIFIHEFETSAGYVAFIGNLVCLWP